MNIFETNVGKITLTKNHFVRSGGQASVYARDGKAYKIYTDPNTALPISKINELSVIENSDIIKPINILLDKDDKPIGYSMRFIDNGIVLCQLFTKSFKNRNGITQECVQKLVEDMRGKIEHIHSKDILIVDLNEMNFLVKSPIFNISYFIDVDSYQTKSFKATFLMESVRDRHSKNFNEMTDWFSFGIISCCLFTGIHPYRGKHPDFTGDPADILDKRMKANVSIFNKNVTIPPICSSFDVIPKNYLNWYKEVFENGKRLPPPSIKDFIAVVIPAIFAKIESDILNIKELYKYDEEILDTFYVNGFRIVKNKTSCRINDKEENKLFLSSEVGITPKFNRIIFADIKNDKLSLYDNFFGKEIDVNINCQNIMSYSGRLYVKNLDNLYEIEFIELPTKTIAAANIICNIIENATQFFDGVIFQDILGSCFCSFFPEKKKHIQLNLKELDKYTIIDAKYESNMLMVLASKTFIKDNKKNNQTDKFVFNFSTSSYSVRKTENASSEINFVVLDNGICVDNLGYGNIEIFMNNCVGEQSRKIQDNAVKNIKLLKNGTKVLFFKDNIIYSLETKKDKK
jgi:hypothetical protein